MSASKFDQGLSYILQDDQYPSLELRHTVNFKLIF